MVKLREADELMLILKQRDWVREVHKCLVNKTSIRSNKKLLSNIECLEIESYPELMQLHSQLQVILIFKFGRIYFRILRRLISI